MGVGLREVAAACGVSPATASRALSGAPRVSAQTVARVQEAARRLGYRPNASARALRTARSRFVGLVVTNLENPSYHAVAEVVQRQMAAAGYQLVLSVTGGDPAREREALQVLADHHAEGAVVVGAHEQTVAQIRRLDLPAVHLARRPVDPAGDCVLADDLTGARSATARLTGLGHRRIALIGGPEEVTSAGERADGYRLGLQDAGLRPAAELIVAGPFVPSTGAAAVARLLALPARRRPTALLVSSHEAAFGVLGALREAGVDVPGELSVICYEDDRMMRWWHPAVTVVDINAAAMGELAAVRLVERIERIATTPQPDRSEVFRVGTRLVVRASCGPVRGRT